MLDDWAFARVELEMKSAEFFALTERQWDALLDKWREKQERELAVRMSVAMNARWGHKRNALPFTTADFMPTEPLSPEEQAVEDERARVAEVAKFKRFYSEMNQDLPPITQPKPVTLSKKPRTKRHGLAPRKR